MKKKPVPKKELSRTSGYNSNYSLYKKTTAAKKQLKKG
jgi:hypothetical protein